MTPKYNLIFVLLFLITTCEITLSSSEDGTVTESNSGSGRVKPNDDQNEEYADISKEKPLTGVGENVDKDSAGDVKLRTKRQISGNNDFLDLPHGLIETLMDEYPLPGRSEPFDEYDFVIVGGGPAGCVLASRLTEGGKWTVLLLEAGATDSIITEMPFISGLLQDSNYFWPYTLEKQDNVCLALENQTCSAGQGKGLGGGSLVNNMVHARGIKRDYDKIAAAGNYGWSYDEVLPYFKKSEKASLNGEELLPHHGRDGLIRIEYRDYSTIYGEAFLEAAQEMGEKIGDYNDGHGLYFNKFQLYQHKGHRETASRAFLRPFRNRRNLHILTKSRALKVNINSRTKTARSVEYVRSKKLRRVRARKEIILSAGSYSTPKLLMLSGIGPKDHLRELGVPLVQDLKVGETLYEHIGFAGIFCLTDEKITSALNETMARVSSILRWAVDGSGPGSVMYGEEMAGFINVAAEGEEPNIVELVLLSESIASKNVGREQLHIDEEFYRDNLVQISDVKTFSVLVFMLNPKSRGYIKLKSKNPYHWPRVYGRLLTDERDLDTLVAGIRYTQRFLQMNAFKRLNARINTKPVSKCAHLEFDTDDYWKCAVKHQSSNARHPVGTCKMGPDADPEAVVDPELRVRGVKKLRVVDASVLPYPTSGHTVAPAYMIGEKAADMIKTTWNF